MEGGHDRLDCLSDTSLRGIAQSQGIMPIEAPCQAGSQVDHDADSSACNRSPK